MTSSTPCSNEVATHRPVAPTRQDSQVGNFSVQLQPAQRTKTMVRVGRASAQEGGGVVLPFPGSSFGQIKHLPGV